MSSDNIVGQVTGILPPPPSPCPSPPPPPPLLCNIPLQLLVLLYVHGLIVFIININNHINVLIIISYLHFTVYTLHSSYMKKYMQYRLFDTNCLLIFIYSETCTYIKTTLQGTNKIWSLYTGLFMQVQ